MHDIHLTFEINDRFMAIIINPKLNSRINKFLIIPH